jgi:hypothetical protein
VKLLTTFFAMSLLSCSAPETNWTTMTPASRQQLIRQVTSKCGLPADRLQLFEGDSLVLRPDPNDSYERIDCLLGELKKVRGIRMGFVGNEAYVEDTQ